MAPLPFKLQQSLKEMPLWEPAIVREPQLAMEAIDDQGGAFGRNYRHQPQEEQR
jgi:hypothetical protein